MNNTFFLLRHGKTKVDSSLPTSEWNLSYEGECQAQDLLKEIDLHKIDLIITSTEKKAFQTALPLSTYLDKEIIQIDSLSELDRDEGGFIDSSEFDMAVKYCLTHLDSSYSTAKGEWESARHAMERFYNSIQEIDKKYSERTILIVGHGLTLNLLFAKLLNQLDTVHERFTKTCFCSWGIVKNNQVVKDLLC